MAKEMWTITTNHGYGPSYSISFRTELLQQHVDKVILSEVIIPAPEVKFNIDECSDAQKVVVQNVGNFSRDELEQLYWKIHATLSVL